MKKVYKIYTDGGARGNPGPAGVGFVVFDENKEIIYKGYKYLGETTNNQAEYRAVILALKYLVKKFGLKTKEINFQFFGDSQLVINQLNGVYQIKEETLFGNFIEIWNLKVKNFPNISFNHVRRDDNKLADQLANKAMGAGA